MPADVTARVTQPRLITGAFWGLVALALGTALALVLTVTVTRTLPMGDAGVFFIGVTMVNLLVLFGRYGYDVTVLRFAGAAWQGERQGEAMGYMRYALRRVALTGTLVCLVGLPVVYVLTPSLISTEYPRYTLAVFLLGVIPLSLVWVYSASFKASSFPGFGSFLGRGMASLVSILLLLAAARYFGRVDVRVASVMWVAGAFTASLIAVLVARRRIGPIRIATPIDAAGAREMNVASRSLLVVTVLTFCNTQIGPLILGWFASDESVAALVAATRLAAVVSLALMAANAVLPPRFAHLYAEGKFAELERLALLGAAVTTALVVPVFIIITIYNGPIMGLFGEGYSAYGQLLVIVSTGQLISAMCGSVGFLLNMAGHQDSLLKGLFVVTVVATPVTVALASVWGASGVASGMVFTLILQNMIFLGLVYRKLGIRLFVFRLLPARPVSTGSERLT